MFEQLEYIGLIWILSETDMQKTRGHKLDYRKHIWH